MISTKDMPPLKVAVGDTVFWTERRATARAGTAEVTAVGRKWIWVRRDDGCTCSYGLDGRPKLALGWSEQIRSAEQEAYLQRISSMEARLRRVAHLLGISVVAVRTDPTRVALLPFERAEALTESLEALAARLGLDNTSSHAEAP